jgi:ABC-type nitrate/sulfonate/bicarbonate transport system ATPase subunit
MDPLLAIKEISKTYPGKNTDVLKSITLSAREGEFVSIVGPSGCGKSTLFNILAGVEKETGGEVFLNGKEIISRRGKFGYMPQSPLLLPWRNTVGQVALGLEILKINPKTARGEALQLLDQFNLSKYALFHPRHLSGGMKQRVALLRTVLFNSKLLLLDEPFGALDQITRLSAQTWLLELKRKLDPTVLLITHDIREAIFLSDVIYIMSPAPSRIVAKFEVNLPHPRLPEYRTEKSAIDLEKKILSILSMNKSYEI